MGRPTLHLASLFLCRLFALVIQWGWAPIELRLYGSDLAMLRQILSGGAFLRPLATAIVGGATILALYFAPSGYVLLMCRGGREEEASADVEAPALAPKLVTAG